MFNLVGIDWGSKWVGIAIADSQTKLAIPYKSVLEKDFYSELKELLLKYQVSKFVVGRPVNFKLQPTEITDKVESFARKLSSDYPEIEVVLFNERSSSQQSLLGFKPEVTSSKSSIGLRPSRGITSPAKKIASNSLHALSAKTILEYYLG